MQNDDTHQRVQERFGEFAQRYVTSTVHGTGYSLDRLIELIAPKQGQRMLDIATGGGHVARALAAAGATVIASDLTIPMLQAARASINEAGINASYLRNDAQHLPFADKSLDAVTCRLAAHHFPDAAEFVRECARVVRPGGLVGLVDQIGPQEIEAARYKNAYEKLRDPSHVHEFSREAWEGMFADAGLRITNADVSRSRLDFNWWTHMQNNDAETVLRLRVMLKQVPGGVREFLEPEFTESGNASFLLTQLILIGQK